MLLVLVLVLLVVLGWVRVHTTERSHTSHVTPHTSCHTLALSPNISQDPPLKDISVGNFSKVFYLIHCANVRRLRVVPHRRQDRHRRHRRLLPFAGVVVKALHQSTLHLPCPFNFSVLVCAGERTIAGCGGVDDDWALHNHHRACAEPAQSQHRATTGLAQSHHRATPEPPQSPPYL